MATSTTKKDTANATAAAADRIKAATLNAVKGLSRVQTERAVAAAARNVNAYGQKEEGPSRWQERKEAKRQMYLMSTEKAVKLGVRKDNKEGGSGCGVGSQQCQKCFKLGHWTFECRNERVYVSRPSRTQLLKNPTLGHLPLHELYDPPLPSVEEAEAVDEARPTEFHLSKGKQQTTNSPIRKSDRRSRKRRRSKSSTSSDESSPSPSSSEPDEESSSSSEDDSSITYSSDSMSTPSRTSSSSRKTSSSSTVDPPTPQSDSVERPTMLPPSAGSEEEYRSINWEESDKRRQQLKSRSPTRPGKRKTRKKLRK